MIYRTAEVITQTTPKIGSDKNAPTAVIDARGQFGECPHGAIADMCTR